MLLPHFLYAILTANSVGNHPSFHAVASAAAAALVSLFASAPEPSLCVCLSLPQENSELNSSR